MTVHLSTDFDIPIQSLYSSRIALLGKSNSGKTNTMQVIAHACLTHDIPYTFINPISLLHPMPGAVIVRWRDPGALTLTEASAPLLAEMAVRERITVLIDLRMCPAAERTPIVTAYLQALWNSLLEQGSPSPYGVFVDEAQLFAPQDGNSTVKPIMVDMAMRGRHMGVISVIATQRPAKIDKDILNQASLTIVHRLSAQTDTKILGDQLPDIALRDLNQMMRKLATGQAVVIGDPLFLGEDDYRTVQVRFAGDAEQGDPAVKLIPARQLDDALIERLRTLLSPATEPSAVVPPRTIATTAALALSSGAQQDEIAILKRQVAELNEKLIGIYRTLNRTLPVANAKGSATTAGGTQLELMEAAADHREEVVVERTTERTTERFTSSRSLSIRTRNQREGFERFTADLRRLSKFQRAMLLMLSENPQRAYHVDELAPHFDRAPKTCYNTALILLSMNLVRQVQAKTYAANVAEYLQSQYPDLTIAELFEQLINVLAA